MKKKLIHFFSLIMTLFASISGIGGINQLVPVYAAGVKLNMSKDVKAPGDTGANFTGEDHYSIFWIGKSGDYEANGAICVDKHLMNTSASYTRKSLSSEYSKTQVNMFKALGYFGYGYKGDKSDAMIAATFAAVRGINAGKHGTYHISSNPIKNLKWVKFKKSSYQSKLNTVRDHVFDIYDSGFHTSWNGKKYHFNGTGKDHAITIKDKNEILQYLGVVSCDSDLDYKITGNSLKIWAKDEFSGTKKFTVGFTENSYSSDKTPSYNEGNSATQSLVSLGAPTEKSTVKFVVDNTPNPPEPASINLTKKPTDTGVQGELSGAVYELHADEKIKTTKGQQLYKKNDLISVKDATGYSEAVSYGDDGAKTTNANGKIKWTNLYPGKYYIIETSAPSGFKLNENKIRVNAGEDRTYNKASNEDTTPHPVQVQKTDTDGNNLSGITFLIKPKAQVDANGWDNTEDVGTLVTGDDGKSNIVYVDTGSYYIKEFSAPGYVIDSSMKEVSFTKDETSLKTVSFVDKKFYVRKTDSSGQTVTNKNIELAVVRFGGSPNNGDDVVDRWNLNDSSALMQSGKYAGYHQLGNVEAGQKYTLYETASSDGYAIASPVTFEVTSGDSDGVAEIKDKKVIIKKKDTSGAMIAGAHMQILNSDNTIVSGNDWVTDGNDFLTSNLEIGKTYILHEVEAPKGYVKAKDVQFTVADDDKDQEVDMVDKQVFANKKNCNGDLVAGAELRVIDANGNECDRWTSTKDGDGYHAIKNLEEGQSYTLEEVKAPNGFVRAKPIRIDVTTDKVNQFYTMINKQYFLRKVDVDGRLLDDVHAKLAVVKRGDDPKDASKILDTWYTDDKNAIIQDGDNKGYHAVSGLEEGGQYTVYEVETPKGYVTFKPEDFDVTEEKVDQWRTVIDKRVGVTKTDIGTKTLKDAHLQVIDANNRNVICDQWVTDDSGFWWVSGLEEDHDYILVETKAPYNYVIATEIPFRVTHDSNEKKNNQFLTMKDKQVHVKKQDLGGQEVPGAKMCVIDNDDNNRVVYSWTSGNKETIVQYLREGHHYTFHEEASPDGYVVATDLKFYVNDYKINETYKVTDKRVRALKTDVNHENPIEGAKLSVIDKDSGKTVDTWRTTKDFHYVNNLIEGKTYIMREEEAPKGYVRANDVIFTVSRAKETQSVYMVDKRVKISKKGVKVDSEVEGAKMAIYKSEDGKITDDVAVDTWTTTKDPHYADGLSEGHEYTLVELRAPEGYVKAKPITFIATAASEDGIKADQLEVMIDKRFQVSKTDVTGKKEVPGAHLEVTDAKTGKLIKEWVSTTEPYYVSGLEEGRTYILSETRAPKGYAVAESVQFYITEEKVDQKCIMKDKQVSVTKTDITGTKEVPGAKLEVIDKDTKKTVDKWISGSKKHYVDNLKENHDYILKETRAPKGYVKAEQIEFRVTGEKVNQKHIMKDKQVTVTKTDITGGKEVPGAHLTVTDKKTGKKVDSWISTEKPHNVSGLEEKHTYILTEKLAPKGYVKAESVEFYVSNAKINQKHLMKDKRVFITKTDITTGKELPGAHLSVTDKKTGKVVDRWVSGYHPHAVSGLEEGRRYILKEVTAPNGYMKAESIEFLVTKKKVNQKHIMKDRPYAPKTGDETDATPYIIGAGGAVAVIAAVVIISVIRKKKKNK